MVRCARSSPHPQECDLVPSEAVPDLQRLVVCSASAATCSDPARELRGRAGRVGLTGCTTAREATTAAAVRAAAATASETATRAHCSEGRVGSLRAGRSWEGSEGSSAPVFSSSKTARDTCSPFVGAGYWSAVGTFYLLSGWLVQLATHHEVSSPTDSGCTASPPGASAL